MSSLGHKQIVLGISGSIAAYKSAELVRLLTKADAQVQVVLTRGGAAFVSPLTLQALARRQVKQDLLDPSAEAAMGHIELARWADVVLVAPASANFMARLNVGLADDLLTTLCLATQAPVALAPAMNQAMWQHPTTQHNLQGLMAKDVIIYGPAEGDQACGDLGPGRMLEPDELVDCLNQLFAPRPLAGKRVLINAGPTREAIDPVRYLSNQSSGKMGFALAQAAVEAGAAVTLVAGPVSLTTPKQVKRIDVTSAEQMLAAVLAAVPQTDIFIAAAAVADYRPFTIAHHKLKKHSKDNQQLQQLTLEPNPDILAQVAGLSSTPPFCVGFAAETENLINHAKAKMQQKKLPMIIANDVSLANQGFNVDNNAVQVLTRHQQLSLGPMNKGQLARQLIHIIADVYQQQQTTGTQS
jgi:phosphopantothenoylcysteine decarboxylase/phosphopantothenate--cysteine ligase